MSETPVWARENTSVNSPVAGMQTETRPWARWVAKNVDVTLFFLPMTVFYYTGIFSNEIPAIDVEGLFTPQSMLVDYVLYPVAGGLAFVVFEALLIAQFGTTPGKWMMGIHLVDREDGQHPSLMTSLRRSLSCLFWGQALFLSFVQILGWILSWNRLQKHGETRWDAAAGIGYQTAAVGWPFWVFGVWTVIMPVLFAFAYGFYVEATLF